MTIKINLCLYNHSRSISDQVWFAQELFVQHGYELVCTNTLRPDSINLMIENHIEQDVAAIDAFCRRFNKQVGLIMTEHIEIEPGGLSFNGSPLEDSEYIDNKEQRLFNVLGLADHVFAFFTFGELPELHTWSSILPGRQVHRLPYPSVRAVDRPAGPYSHDLVFTGVRTQYRDTVLKQIEKDFRVVQSTAIETEETRISLYSSAKVALNIPQTADWQWISPMRILFGLRVGTPTVHLGARDSTLFSRVLLDPIDLDRAVADHESLFQRQITSYEDFVGSRYNARFPAGILDVWARTELLA